MKTTRKLTPDMQAVLDRLHRGAVLLYAHDWRARHNPMMYWWRDNPSLDGQVRPVTVHGLYKRGLVRYQASARYGAGEIVLV